MRTSSGVGWGKWAPEEKREDLRKNSGMLAVERVRTGLWVGVCTVVVPPAVDSHINMSLTYSQAQVKIPRAQVGNVNERNVWVESSLPLKELHTLCFATSSYFGRTPASLKKVGCV